MGAEMRNSNMTGFVFSSLPTHTYRQRIQLTIVDAMSCAHEHVPGRYSRPGIRIHPTDKYSRNVTG